MVAKLATWSIQGLGQLIERKWLAWFYRRRTSQHWSPLMHEVTTEYGARFGALRIGWSWTARHFHDGKKPTVIPGPHL